MTGLVVAESRIPAMMAEAIDKVRDLEAITRELPQVEIPSAHVLHGGMYARTIRIPANVVLTGVFIRVPTLLVFDGNATVNAGEEAVTPVGRHVLAASAHRRQDRRTQCANRRNPRVQRLMTCTHHLAHHWRRYLVRRYSTK